MDRSTFFRIGLASLLLAAGSGVACGGVVVAGDASHADGTGGHAVVGTSSSGVVAVSGSSTSGVGGGGAPTQGTQTATSSSGGGASSSGGSASSSGGGASSGCGATTCAWTGPFGCNCSAMCGGGTTIQADCGWNNSGTTCSCVVDGQNVGGSDGIGPPTSFACDLVKGPCAKYFPATP